MTINDKIALGFIFIAVYGTLISAFCYYASKPIVERFVKYVESLIKNERDI